MVHHPRNILTKSNNNAHTRYTIFRPKPEIVAHSFGLPGVDLKRTLQLLLTSQDEKLLLEIIEQPLAIFHKSSALVPMMVQYFFCESVESTVHDDNDFTIPERSSDAHRVSSRHVPEDHSWTQSGSAEAHAGSLSTRSRDED